MDKSKMINVLKTLGLVAVIAVIYKAMIFVTELVATPIYTQLGWVEKGESLRIGDYFTAPNIIAYSVAVALSAVAYSLILKRKKTNIVKYCSLDVVTPRNDCKSI